MILITNFIKNSSSEVKDMNKQKIVHAPISDPKKSRLKDALLLSKTDTVKSNTKSKPKFKRKTKSKYIFMVSPFTV